MSDAPDSPRTIAGRYRIERELGGGGMSTVYVAEDTKHGRRVAVKLLRPDLAPALSAPDRFNREIEVTARLTHPHILPLLDSGEDDGRTYYVMPFIEGESLRDRLMREHRLPPPAAVRITREVADALAYAHDHGIVHRDIKPENILLSAGHAVVADFGIARAASALPSGNTTKVGLIIGTPAYMSPEQAFGEEIDGRADLYALGCVLFEMLGGQPPFFAPSMPAMLARKLSGNPPDFDVLGDDVPPGLRQLVRRSLATDIAERFASGSDLVEALDALTTGSVTVRAPAAPMAARDAIAVLPFVTMQATGGDDEYIGDGMSEELTNALARVKGLRVIARTSAFAFKNADVDVREIGRRLNVRWIVEGSVRRSGNRLRITAKLIDAETAFEIWSERFDRLAEDLFDVEDEIAASLAQSLAERLAPVTGAVTRTPTAPKLSAPANFAAYEHLLKGRHYFALRTGEGFRQSVEELQQALQLDPDFAQAYAALAGTLATIGLYGNEAPNDVMPLAIEAADHALARGGDIAEMLAARACVSAVYEWNWEASEAGFKRALAANPQYATAHQWYAMQCLLPQGRFDEARESLHRARELDPLSLAIGVSLAGIHYYARDFNNAIAAAREVLRLDERFAMAHYFLGLAQEQAGERAAAMASLRRAAELSPSVEIRSALAYAYATADEAEPARQILGELTAESTTRWVSPVMLAQVEVARGDSAAALAHLERAKAQRAADLMWLGVRPTFDPLRDEPVFRAILKDLGLAGR